MAERPALDTRGDGFAGFHEQMARRRFARPEARAASRAFYASPRVAAETGDAALAGPVTETR
jgi:hypothetical protein